MNATKAKQIRKILNFDPNCADETSKRVYSRAKKTIQQIIKRRKTFIYRRIKKFI